MKGVLSDIIQNSSLIIQNWWDPRKKFCLDSITLFWSLCFGDSITQKSEWWSLKKKQISVVFKFGHPWFSGISVNRVHQWALRPVLCPINTMLWPLELSTEHYTQFSEIFFSTKISLFSLPSLNLAPFSLPIDIPSELAPWHRSPCSKTEPGLRSESVFEEQRLIEALNQAWIFTGEFTSPLSCLYLSLPNPVAILYPRCSKSLSRPLHFRSPWSGLGFLLDVKRGVFDLKYWYWLWLVRHVDMIGL